MRVVPAVLLAVASCLLVVAFRGQSGAALTACEVADYSIDAEEARFLTLLNDYRAANGRAALTPHDDLNRTATWMATDLAGNATFGHRDTLGRGAFQRSIECGYSAGASENLTAGRAVDTADEAFAAWKKSTGHNNNMLSSLWVDVGIARVYTPGSTWGWYWATEFGVGEAAEPASPTVAVDTPTPTPANTATPTSTATATATPTVTPTATATATFTPTATPTLTPTLTPTATPTLTPTSTATPTPTATPTSVTAALSCGGAGAELDSEEHELVRLISKHRTQNGRDPLTVNDELNGVAAWMATDLSENPTFGHEDTLGRGPYLRAIECGYSVGAGENLAAGSSWDRAREAFSAWKRSSAHNSNMLAPYWTEVGVARVYVPGSPWRWYWVVEFGTGEPDANQ